MQRHPGTDDLAGALIFAVYFGIYLALTLSFWIGALVEAGVSRHWRWFIGLFAAALIPGLVILAQVTLRLGLPGFNVIGLGLTFAPVLTMLAYGVARIVLLVPLRSV